MAGIGYHPADEHSWYCMCWLQLVVSGFWNWFPFPAVQNFYELTWTGVRTGYLLYVLYDTHTVGENENRNLMTAFWKRWHRNEVDLNSGILVSVTAAYNARRRNHRDWMELAKSNLGRWLVDGLPVFVHLFIRNATTTGKCGRFWQLLLEYQVVAAMDHSGWLHLTINPTSSRT